MLSQFAVTNHPTKAESLKRNGRKAFYKAPSGRRALNEVARMFNRAVAHGYISESPSVKREYYIPEDAGRRPVYRV